MPKRAQEKAVSIRPLVAEDTSAILSAILTAADFGVLLTSLDHTALACNQRFGDIWEVNIDQVVQLGVDDLRKKVHSLIPDVKSWEANLDRLYSDPMAIQEDEQVLLKSPPMTIRRFSGPVIDARGAVIGRLWTFTDVTREVRRRELREALNQFTSFYAAEPTTVYDHIVKAIAEHFPGAATFLSIRHGDFLEFKATAGLPPEAQGMKGNNMKDSYCQFAIEDRQALQIVDATLEAKYDVLPRQVGYTRYLGVPLFADDGKIIGTLCMMDGLKGQAFDEDEERFISLLAMRAASEVSRERHIARRLEEKEAAIQKQAADTKKTRRVLEVMNAAFGLISLELDTDELARRQLLLIQALPDYESAAIALDSESVGWCISSGKTTIDRYDDGTGDWGERLGSHEVEERHLVYADLNIGRLFLGRTKDAAVDALYATHAEAIVEQVTLLFSTHLLRRQLDSATTELAVTQGKLLQSEKLSIVGTLAAATAHDIKNIMSALSLELSIGFDDPQSALARVKDHLDRFSVLAHRLLSYARPRMLEKRSIDVGDLIQRVVALTSGHIRLCNVQLQYSPAPSLPAVLGDNHQLEHLFVNLTLNALQAMDRNGGELKISARAEGSSLVVDLSDTGRGMTDEQVERIFEPFYSTRQEGFGLGLYSCQRIVNDHGGTIEVRSTVGIGTQFAVRLPTVKTNDNQHSDS